MFLMSGVYFSVVYSCVRVFKEQGWLNPACHYFVWFDGLSRSLFHQLFSKVSQQPLLYIIFVITKYVL